MKKMILIALLTLVACDYGDVGSTTSESTERAQPAPELSFSEAPSVSSQEGDVMFDSPDLRVESSSALERYQRAGMLVVRASKIRVSPDETRVQRVTPGPGGDLVRTFRRVRFESAVGLASPARIDREKAVWIHDPRADVYVDASGSAFGAHDDADHPMHQLEEADAVLVLTRTSDGYQVVRASTVAEERLQLADGSALDVADVR